MTTILNMIHNRTCRSELLSRYYANATVQLYDLQYCSTVTTVTNCGGARDPRLRGDCRPRSDLAIGPDVPCRVACADRRPDSRVSGQCGVTCVQCLLSQVRLRQSPEMCGRAHRGPAGPMHRHAPPTGGHGSTGAPAVCAFRVSVRLTLFIETACRLDLLPSLLQKRFLLYETQIT